MNPARGVLQRVATHVLARARFGATGKFGLRATPGGFGTPAFGADVEVVRVSGVVLVHERAGRTSCMPIDGSTLSELAAFVGVDLDEPFDVGHDTPAIGDPDAALSLDLSDARLVAEWFQLGWQVIDAAVSTERDPMAIQLWPEHFDAGTSVAVGNGDGDRCNLGASPGDSFSEEPYLYVGPWNGEQPGDARYWNAPFGAVMTRRELLGADDPIAAGIAFMRRGLELLR